MFLISSLYCYRQLLLLYSQLLFKHLCHIKHSPPLLLLPVTSESISRAPVCWSKSCPMPTPITSFSSSCHRLWNVHNGVQVKSWLYCKCCTSVSLAESSTVKHTEKQAGMGRRSVSFPSSAKENNEAKESKATHSDRLLISAEFWVGASILLMCLHLFYYSSPVTVQRVGGCSKQQAWGRAGVDTLDRPQPDPLRLSTGLLITEAEQQDGVNKFLFVIQFHIWRDPVEQCGWGKQPWRARCT